MLMNNTKIFVTLSGVLVQMAQVWMTGIISEASRHTKDVLYVRKF